MNRSLTPKQVKRTARFAVYEGMSASAADGASDDLYVPYALAAGASLSQVGLLVTFQQLLASFCYLKLSNIGGVIGSRKRAVLILVLIDVITFLPFTILPFFFRDYLLEAVFFFYVLATLPNVVISPIWASWITEIIPAPIRGRYLGSRATFTGASSLLCFVSAGLILNYFKGSVFDGFALVFGFGALARLVSWVFFWKMDDVPLKQKEAAVSFGLSDFKQALSSGRFGHFMIYSAMFYFTVFLASPFYAAFMLNDLKFSYVAFMIVICSAEAAKLLTYRFWGKYADAEGNLKVVRIASWIIPLSPILWLFSHNIWYLVGIQILSGLAWAGFDLCSPNFVYSALPVNNRIKFIACYRALNGLGMAMGALVGGYLATHLPGLFGYPLLALFLVSGILRGFVSFRMLPSIVDVARRKSGVSPWVYKIQPTPVARVGGDSVAWGLLYAPFGSNIGNALGAKHVLTSRVDPERRGLFYEKSSRRALAKTGLDNRQFRPSEPSNFRIFQGAARKGTLEPRKNLSSRMWQSIKDWVNPPGPAVPTSAGPAKEGLLHKTSAWRDYLPPPQAKEISKEPATPQRPGLLHKTEAWPENDNTAAKSEPPKPVPEKGLLKKPGEWPSVMKGEGQPADKSAEKKAVPRTGKMPNADAGTSTKIEPPYKANPEHQGLFYDHEEQKAILKEKGVPDKPPPDFRGEPEHGGLLHKSGEWDKFSSPKPDGAPEVPGNEPHREALLHKQEAWDRFVKSDDSQSGAGAEKRGATFRKGKPPSKTDRTDETSSKRALPKGRLHRPDTWPESKEKPKQTKPEDKIARPRQPGNDTPRRKKP